MVRWENLRVEPSAQFRHVMGNDGEEELVGEVEGLLCGL